MATMSDGRRVSELTAGAARRVTARRAGAQDQDLALLASLAVAVAGNFPLGLLFVFPLLAGLTLRDVHRGRRLLVIAVSAAFLAAGLAVDLSTL